MNATDLTELLKTRAEDSEALQQHWATLLPELKPDARQFLVWLELHPLSRLVDAVTRTASKNMRLNGTMTLEHSVRFCSKVANTLKTEAQQHGGAA